MKSITQKDYYGCGIACFAFVNGITYNEATKYFHMEYANTRGYYKNDFIKAFDLIGKNYDGDIITWKTIPKIYNQGSIIFIDRSNVYPAGHFLARSKNNFMDPWVNFIENKEIKNARSGFVEELPGIPVYIMFEIS